MKKINTFNMIFNFWFAALLSGLYFKLGPDEPWWQYVVCMASITAMLWLAADDLDNILNRFATRDDARR